MLSNKPIMTKEASHTTELDRKCHASFIHTKCLRRPILRLFNTNRATNYHFNESGDLLLVLTKKFMRNNGIKKGDTYEIQPEENKIILTPIIRMSRLKREWKKYKRRLKDSKVSLIVYRAEQHVGYLNKRGYEDL